MISLASFTPHISSLFLSDVSLYVFLYVRMYFLDYLLVWLCRSEAVIFDVAIAVTR